MAQPTPKIAVNLKLASMLSGDIIGPAQFFAGTNRGLEFFDEPFAILLNAPVESSGNDGRPITHRNYGLKKNFATILGILPAALVQDAGMQLGTGAESAP